MTIHSYTFVHLEIGWSTNVPCSKLFNTSSCKYQGKKSWNSTVSCSFFWSQTQKSSVNNKQNNWSLCSNTHRGDCRYVVGFDTTETLSGYSRDYSKNKAELQRSQCRNKPPFPKPQKNNVMGKLPKKLLWMTERRVWCYMAAYRRYTILKDTHSPVKEFIDY